MSRLDIFLFCELRPSSRRNNFWGRNQRLLTGAGVPPFTGDAPVGCLLGCAVAFSIVSSLSRKDIIPQTLSSINREVRPRVFRRDSPLQGRSEVCSPPKIRATRDTPPLPARQRASAHCPRSRFQDLTRWLTTLYSVPSNPHSHPQTILREQPQKSQQEHF